MGKDTMDLSGKTDPLIFVQLHVVKTTTCQNIKPPPHAPKVSASYSLTSSNP